MLSRISPKSLLEVLRCESDCLKVRVIHAASLGSAFYLVDVFW